MANGKPSTALVVAAGAAGGMAEVLWVAAATMVLGMDGWAIPRAVTATIIPDLATSLLAPWIGLLIHLLLSIALARLLVHALQRRLGTATLFLSTLAALAMVWAFNFLLFLPLINPAFVTLLPHPVTLISKLLFGMAMASVLVWTSGETP